MFSNSASRSMLSSARLSHDGRDGGEAGLLGGAPPALPHDELYRGPPAGPESSAPRRLHEPELADGVHKFGERLLVEHLPRLPRVSAR